LCVVIVCCSLNVRRTKNSPGCAEAALHRELLEELGCEVCILQTLPAVTHEYAWCTVEMVPFVCELTAASPEPHPHEHTGLVWVERPQLAGYPLAPADVPLLTFLA